MNRFVLLVLICAGANSVRAESREREVLQPFLKSYCIKCHGGAGDVNEPPGVALTNTVTTLPEDTTAQTKVADIVVSDDALGSETLGLTGDDANLFEIVGFELF